ncbi:MAG TPA: hypothetical protein VMU88_03690 [bacterium]|nr:hypothetical protein [bacterium]
MKKQFFAACLFLLAALFPAYAKAAPSVDAAYQYAYSLFAANNLTQAKQYYLYVVLNGTDSEQKANSLYFLSQCYLRLGDLNNCVKAANMLAGGYPKSSVVKNGMLTNFCTNLISQITNLQTDWDYWRYQDGTDDKNEPIWKESVPVGKRIKRIDFKLAFGLYRALLKIDPKSAEVADAKKKLDGMLSRPLTIIWVDEKAAPNRLGHPADFFSYFTKNDKKAFSKVICDRMFYDWKSDMLYRFMDMYSDVRNLKPQYTAKTFNLDSDNSDTALINNSTPAGSAPPPPPLPGAPDAGATTPAAATAPAVTDTDLTLGRLFAISAYDPYSDTFGNPAEAAGAVAPSL